MPRISPLLTFIATNPPGSPNCADRALAGRLHVGVDREHEVVAGARLAHVEAAGRSASPEASTWTRVAPLTPRSRLS